MTELLFAQNVKIKEKLFEDYDRTITGFFNGIEITKNMWASTDKKGESNFYSEVHLDIG